MSTFSERVSDGVQERWRPMIQKELTQSSLFTALIHELEHYFSKSRSWDSLDSFDAQREILSRHLSDRHKVMSLLLDAIGAIGDGNMPRGASYQHAHGFTKLSLYRSETQGFNVRLHIWWTGEQASDDSPHEHRWSFCSRLLSGSLHILNYAKIPTGERERIRNAFPLHSYRYFDADPDGSKIVEPAGTQYVVLASEYVLSEGASHQLWYTEPHQVLGLSGPVAATLVVTGPPEREYS